MSEEFHPAFPQPADNPSLWRYLSPIKFRWLVEHRRLFMTSADRLGDPLEGTAPSGQGNWWERQAKSDDTEMRARVERNRQFVETIAALLRGRYYVSCWHMAESLEEAMWAAYAPGKEAIAVRTSLQQLRASLPPYIFLGVVRYLDYSQAELPSMNLLEYVSHKDLQFSFEQEVRAVALAPVKGAIGADHFHSNYFEKEDEAGFYVFAPKVDLSKLIDEVVVPTDAPREFLHDIEELCKSAGLPTPHK